ncbi:hypothetical protein MSKU15_2993 [Komagataeibacter diospyri]|nr:hypothetical protein MSKU15_2993 [Komagataeibacter diospyri]
MAAQPSGEESSGTPLRPADRGVAGLRLDQPSDRGHGVRTRQPPRRYDAGMAGPSEGDDAIWRETVTLALWETGSVRRSFLPSPMLRRLFTRSWAGLRRAVRQAPAPGTGASRQSGPDDPSLAACRAGPFTDGVGAGVSSHGPSLQAHGVAIELRPAGSPGGAFRVTGERASRHQVRRNWGARRHCGSGVWQQMSGRFHETVMGMALTRHSLSGTSRPGCPSASPCRPDCPECQIRGTP